MSDDPAPRPDPTPEEWKEMGVEFNADAVVTPEEPPRLAFEEKEEIARQDESLPPDRKIVTADGTAMRERIERVETRSDGVVSPAEEVAPTMIALGISYALLTEEDKVALGEGDKPKIGTCYPVTFSAEGLGRIGSPEALRAVLLIEREKAAHQAKLEFDGMALAEQIGI